MISVFTKSICQTPEQTLTWVVSFVSVQMPHEIEFYCPQWDEVDPEKSKPGPVT